MKPSLLKKFFEKREDFLFTYRNNKTVHKACFTVYENKPLEAVELNTLSIYSESFNIEAIKGKYLILYSYKCGLKVEIKMIIESMGLVPVEKEASHGA